MDNLEKLEKPKESSWGGKRDNSGRRPLLNKEDIEKVKGILAQHGMAEVEEDYGDGKLVKLTRMEHLLLKLYELGISKGNIMAIKEYFDRQMGKSKESMDITTDGRPLIQLSGEILQKYGITPSDTKDNSERHSQV